MMNKYDTVLAGIFCSMVAGSLLGILTPLPLNAAVSAGGILSFGLMYHGMFRQAPL